MNIWDKIKSFFKRDTENEPVLTDEEVGELDEIDEDFVTEEVTVESLAEEQKVIDKLYEEEGLSDRVLDMQVALNMKRNKYDISDKTHLNDEGWSQ